VFSSDIKASNKDLTERTLIKLRQYAFFLCDATTEFYEIIMKFHPSKVAAACAYFARKLCKLDMVWD
jgi:hypothetical protein